MDPSCRRRWTPPGCLPRRRGDGPALSEMYRLPLELTPQARGWTLSLTRSLPKRAAYPAGAGMDLRIATVPAACCRLPRRRGDGPWTFISPAAAVVLTPQARGWTLLPPPRRRDAHAYPAGAGMDRAPAPRGVAGCSLPRRRGDGPSLHEALVRAGRPTPQARGWTELKLHVRVQRCAYPAGAGMDPLFSAVSSALSSLPRRRGDGPRVNSWYAGPQRLTPQARGWTPGTSGRGIRAGAYPAGAGMDRCCPML